MLLDSQYDPDISLHSIREEFMTKADASAEIKRLDDALDDMGFPLVFCHNDLNIGNIVFDERTGKAALFERHG